MAHTIFLCGHGSYNPENGFELVPRGCSVKFYSHFMKTVVKGDTEKLIAGSYTGEPHEIFETFKNCPNMTLHPPDGADHVWSKYQAALSNPHVNDISVYFTSSALTLGEFFERNADKLRAMVQRVGHVDLTWACCRSVKFKRAHLIKADEAGVNAVDRFTLNKFKLRYKKRNGDMSEYQGPIQTIKYINYGEPGIY